MLDSKKFLQLGASRSALGGANNVFKVKRLFSDRGASRSALGGANNVFKVKRLFSDRKRGCDRATSPLYEPRVHLRFEI